MEVASLDDLLARRVAKAGEVAVSSGDVLRWSEAHRETSPRHWPDRTADWVAPPAMVTSFVRPLEWRPDRQGPPTDRGSTLHEELKAALGLPLGIAAGYDLELHGLLRDGDRVAAVERIASVGEPETTRLGPGRRWLIENEIRRAAGDTGAGAGELVAVERFHMLGYDPTASPAPDAPAPNGSVRHPRGDELNHGASSAGPGGSVRDPSGDELSHGGGARVVPAGSDRVEELEVTAVVIAMGAAANRVWVAAHLDRDAARAAGVSDQFMDTSTQVGLLSGVAVRAAGPDGSDARPGRLSLRMRRPICPGDLLRMEARVVDEGTDAAGVRWGTVAVEGRVGDVVHSTLTARVALGGPTEGSRGPDDPWRLLGEAWRP